MQKNQSSLTYMPQLDALRAIAVSMVIFSHWSGYHKYSWQDSFWFNGMIGVQLFFVLSGFLITGILLKERSKAEAIGIASKDVLKVFYVRRVLRIFPLFYATLFIAYWLKQPDVVWSFKWHITYLSNFFFAKRGEYLGTVSHFWSLAVEEQFYIFWPVLMLYTPKKYLLAVISCIVFSGPIFRFLTEWIFHWNEVAVNVITISSLDALGLGGLLALIQEHPEKSKFQKLSSVLYYGSLLCLILFFLVNLLPAGWIGNIGMEKTLSRMLLPPALLIIVWTFANGIPGMLGKIASTPVLLFLGRISYGIYVLHFFVPYYTSRYFYERNYLFWDEVGVFPYFLLNLFILLSICTFSWYVFESRLINLKRFFPYSSTAVEAVA